MCTNKNNAHIKHIYIYDVCFRNLKTHFGTFMRDVAWMTRIHPTSYIPLMWLWSIKANKYLVTSISYSNIKSSKFLTPKLRVGIGSRSLICGLKLVPWFLGSLMTMFFSGKKHHPSRCLVSGLKTKPCSSCVTKLSKKTCHFGGPNTMAIHATPRSSPNWFNGCCWRRSNICIFGEGFFGPLS